VVGFLVAGRLFRRIASWRRLGTWLFLASPLTLVLLIWFFATFDQDAIMAGVGIAGLIERVLCVNLAAWFVAIGWKAFRQS
jgi:hypothetical protein